MFPVILNSLWPSQNQLWHIMVGQNIWKVNMDQRFSMLTATSILLLKVYKVFLKVTFRKIIYLPIYLSKAKSPEHIADSHILSISKYFSNRKKKKIHEEGSYTPYIANHIVQETATACLAQGCTGRLW